MRRQSQALGFLALLTFGAAFLRWWGLGNRSLWVDELLNAETNQLHTLGQVVAATPVNRMPLDLIVSWLLRFTGDSESALRLPAVVAGTLLVPAIYLLTRRLFDGTAAIVAATLVAFDPFAVWYSQEVSPYALLMLLVTLQAWAALRAADRAGLGDWLLLSLFTALTLYTHYVAALATVAVYSWLLLAVFLQIRAGLDMEQAAIRFMGLAISALIAVAAISLWLPAIRAFLVFGAGTEVAGYRVEGPVFSGLADQLNALGIGWLLCVVALVGIWVALVRRTYLPLFSLGVPLIAWGVALRAGILVMPSRYLAEAWPSALILAAGGVTAIAAAIKRRRWIGDRTAATGLVVVLLAEMSPTLVRWGGEPKDDWRAAAHFIRANSTANSPVLTMGAGSDWAAPSVQWYLQRDHSPRLVVDVGGSSSDSRSVTDAMAARIRVANGPAFAVIATATGPRDLRTSGRAQTGVFANIPSPPAGGRRRDFVGVTVVTAPDARTLLRWGSSFVPGTLATDALVEQRPLSDQLLPRGGTGPYRLTSSGRPVQESWSLRLKGDQPLVARFRCESAGRVDARLFVLAQGADGRPLALLPNVAGYRCGGGWGSFAFSSPPGTRAIKLGLQADGTGTATFDNVQLLEVPGT